MLGFLGGLAGGLIGGQSQKAAAEAQERTNRANIAMQEKWNTQSQENWQKEFDRSSIKSRVGAAQAAGISPLAALGVPGSNLPSFALSPQKSPGAYNNGQFMEALAYQLGNIGKDRARADLDSVRLQNEQLKLDLLKKQLEVADDFITKPVSYVDPHSGAIVGGIGTRMHPDATPLDRPGKGLYTGYYDNSDQIAQMGLIPLPVEEIGEIGENLLGKGMAIHGYSKYRTEKGYEPQDFRFDPVPIGLSLFPAGKAAKLIYNIGRRAFR